MKVIVSLSAILTLSTGCVQTPGARTADKKKAANESAETTADGTKTKSGTSQDQNDPEGQNGLSLTEDEQAEAAVEALEEAVANGEEEVADSESADGSAILEMLRQRERTCVEENGVVTVHITRQAEGSAEGDKRAASVEREFDMTRVFSGAEIHCNARGTRAIFPRSLAALDGLTIDAQGKRHIRREYDRKDDEKAAKSLDIRSEGERHSKLAVEESADSWTLRHTRAVRLAQTVEIVGEETKTIERSVETVEGSPLVTSRSWLKGKPLYNSFTLESGAVAIRRASGELVRLEFADVKIERQGPGLCKRDRSGSIKGEVFAAADDTAPARTFTIEFDENGTKIKFSDGSERLINPSICP